MMKFRRIEILNPKLFSLYIFCIIRGEKKSSLKAILLSTKTKIDWELLFYFAKISVSQNQYPEELQRERDVLWVQNS